MATRVLNLLINLVYLNTLVCGQYTSGNEESAVTCKYFKLLLLSRNYTTMVMLWLELAGFI